MHQRMGCIVPCEYQIDGGASTAGKAAQITGSGWGHPWTVALIVSGPRDESGSRFLGWCPRGSRFHHSSCNDVW